MGCAQKNRPGVYARLEHAGDWIESVLNGESFACEHELEFDENGQAVLDITEYRKFTICDYHLDSEGASVKVEVDRIDIENQQKCANDYLAILQVRAGDEKYLGYLDVKDRV